MPEVLQIVFFLGILLVIITLVGHGIWVFLAFLFRGGQKKSKHRDCVYCGKSTTVYENRCQWCMRDLNSELAAELSDIDALLRQLGRFKSLSQKHNSLAISPHPNPLPEGEGTFGIGSKQEDVLDAETLANIAKRVKNYRKELLIPPPPLIATVVTKPIAMSERDSPFADAKIGTVPKFQFRRKRQCDLKNRKPRLLFQRHKRPLPRPSRKRGCSFTRANCRPAGPARAVIAAAGSAKILERNSGRLPGRTQHPLDRIDRSFIGRAADGRLFHLHW